MGTKSWILEFTRGITGWHLTGARRPKRGYVRGADIPEYVRTFCLADERGKTDETTQTYLGGIAEGRTRIVVQKQVPVPVPRKADLLLAKYGAPPQLDVDSASYVGNEADGVYYDAVYHNETWWCVAVVDSDTGAFVDRLTAEPGYASEEEAATAARDAALEWCHWNNVDTGDLDDGYNPSEGT